MAIRTSQSLLFLSTFKSTLSAFMSYGPYFFHGGSELQVPPSHLSTSPHGSPCHKFHDQICLFLAYRMAGRFYSAHPGGLVDGLVQDLHSYSGIGGYMECCLTFENKQWTQGH